MKVDPSELRALATSMDAVAQAIADLDVTTAMTATATALPGTGIATLCADSGAVTRSAIDKVANRCSRVSQIAKGSANTFEITDTDFSAQLDRLST